MSTVITVNLSQVFLDPQNPRHDIIDSQRDLIKAMLEEQGLKLVKLAEDIVKNGVNPSDLPIIIPSDIEESSYIVVEGNRRITALKLLTNPTLCEGEQYCKRFKELSLEFKKNPIYEVNCVFYDQREDARHWIELKHTGENQGVGIVEWSTTAKKRFEAQTGKSGFELQALDYILNAKGTDEQIGKAFRAIDISTVKRLIGDPNVRAFLGLDMNKGILCSGYSPDETLRVLFEFLRPFAAKEKKVNDVYYKNDRINYINDLPESNRPEESKRTDEKWNLGAPPQSTNTGSGASGQSGTEKLFQSKAKPRSKPSSQSRKYLIKDSIPISHSRIGNIYRELKNLDVHVYTNAVSVLLRVFLETSLNNYIKQKNISSHTNDKLSQKIAKTAKYMEDNGILSADELKPVKKAGSTLHGLFTINTLNSYVHNSTIQPKGTELNATWDEMEAFIRKLWN